MPSASTFAVKAASRKVVVAVLVGVGVLALICYHFYPGKLPRWVEPAWPSANNQFEAWQPIYDGVNYCRGHFSQPRLMKAHAIRVDLTAPGISLLANPAAPDAPGFVRSIYPSVFLRRYQLQVVVSATAFHPFVKLADQLVELDGLGISEGRLVKSAALNLDCLVFNHDNSAVFLRQSNPGPQAWTGVGGNWMILTNGVPTPDYFTVEPMSVGGLSADRRYLYWLVVDGRQPGYSEGADATDAARMMQQLGASDALRFDGGSVVTLVRDGGWRGATVLNQPSHPVVRGFERPIGGLLGIRARPLPP